MMKKIITLFIAVLLIASCASQHKIQYVFPKAMASNIRVLYTEQCDKGFALYNNNCARCHNYKVKGKIVIPDFGEEKLVGYAIRTSNKRHESAMPDTLVTAEELGLIMTFLSYKKKN